MIRHKNKKIISIILPIIFAAFLLAIKPSVKAVEGDTSGNVSGTTGGCGDKDSCWVTKEVENGTYQTLSGIRVTIVDGEGNMVSTKSMDYLNSQNWVNFINSNKNYSRCTNSVNHKLAYIKGTSSCSWNKNDGKTTIAKYLSWLPGIYNTKEPNAAQTIKNTIINMDINTLKETFFNDLGYDVDSNSNHFENHYLIIEPLAFVAIGTAKGEKYTGKHYNYYGTYHELAPRLIDMWNVGSLGKSHMPLSIFTTGNEAIGGSGGFNKTNGTYFNGLIKVVKKVDENGKIITGDDSYIKYNSSKTRLQIKDTYWFNQNDENKKIGFGLGIYWLKDFENLTPKTCNYNNSSHFTNATSGPNNEDCCDFVINNLSTYGITKAELIAKYPRCGSAILDACTFSLTTTEPSCTGSTFGNISDIDDWDCIYASAYSNDTNIKNYFLKYGDASSDCQVYCRNKVTYLYPNNSMVALAGNYFTIGNNLNSYSTYIDSSTNTTKVHAATLGPVQVNVTKECKIFGDTNNTTCKDKVNQELNSIKSPTIKFTYDSAYYKNPVEYLQSTSTATSDSTNGIVSKTVTYNYSLPTNTYKYVSKNTGISYKNASLIGKYPYITIEPHSPIHFSDNGSVNYSLTVEKFNLENFDNLIINGNSISTKFSSTIESYIKTLLDSNYNQWFKTINNIMYFNDEFTTLLNNNGYDKTKFSSMACARYNDYDCDFNASNGLYYCYDYDTQKSDLTVYDKFRACINATVGNTSYTQTNYKSDMKYECTFNVNNSTSNTGIDVIYRTISLDNPFPNDDGKGRETGANWCYNYDCSNTNTTVNTYIRDNRGVTTEEIYKNVDPLYKIVLTPSIIKEIRKYNNTTKYDDFNFVCDANGEKCKSNFIRTSLNNGAYDFSSYFSGCGLDSNNSRCQNGEAW